MKIIYSHLKKLLPDLPVDAHTLRDDLTLIGHFVSGFEKLKGESILDLEVRQNRADCLGYYGVARDLSVFYNIDLKLPSPSPLNFTSKPLPVEIESADVKRIQAVRLADIKISPSPAWLSDFLTLHDINPVNNLVDLTNYVMLIYGIPCHAFDPTKTGDNLTWENNNRRYESFTTLDGTKLKLTPDCLLITNNQTPLSLGFIGGQNSGISTDTSSTILEMAIYTPSRIRADSRELKTITEASIRLDKFLDTDTIPEAFSFLISQVLDLCGGHIDSNLYENYPDLSTKISIPFDPSKPAVYAGIPISNNFSLDVLKRLGCQINNNLVIPPSIRKDVNIEEDLIEEVIRFYGFNKIPTDQPLTQTAVSDITPKILYLIEQLKDQLVLLGYDEVRSWPLTTAPLSENAVFAQNSINSEYPVLRESIVQSLKSQLDQYTRLKLAGTQFFEVGKIFSQNNSLPEEKYSLGIYHHDAVKLKSDLKALKLEAKNDGNFAEVILENLPAPEVYIPPDTTNTAIELTSQIITLDANVDYDSPQDPIELIKKYTALIDPAIFWSMEIIDIYHYRYTFRVRYYNCSDKTAKKIHLKTFNLE